LREGLSGHEPVVFFRRVVDYPSQVDWRGVLPHERPGLARCVLARPPVRAPHAGKESRLYGRGGRNAGARDRANTAPVKEKCVLVFLVSSFCTLASNALLSVFGIRVLPAVSYFGACAFYRFRAGIPKAISPFRPFRVKRSNPSQESRCGMGTGTPRGVGNRLRGTGDRGACPAGDHRYSAPVILGSLFLLACNLSPVTCDLNRGFAAKSTFGFPLWAKSADAPMKLAGVAKSGT